MAYKIFVSHVWRTHHDLYWGLIRLLGRARRFRFEDLSVPRLRPFDGNYPEVRPDILRILRGADVVLVINTPVITNSSAVQDELAEAERLGIPVIAVKPPSRWGAVRTCQLPIIQRATAANWTTRSITDKIKEVVPKARRKSVVLITPLEPGYQLAAEAEAASTIIRLSEVAGDDEIAPVETAAVQSQPTPQEVIFGGKDARPVAPVSRSWFSRFWSRSAPASHHVKDRASDD